MNLHIRAAYDLGKDDRANAPDPLAEGERLRITERIDVRLLAAQGGEAVEPVCDGPGGRIARIRSAVVCHQKVSLSHRAQNTLLNAHNVTADARYAASAHVAR